MRTFSQSPFTRRRFLATAGLGLASCGIADAGPARTATAAPPAATVVSDRGGVKTYLLVFAKGQEVLSSLRGFVKEQRLIGGNLSAIGAVSEASLAFFDRDRNGYHPIPVKRQAEVASMTGNLVLVDGEPFLHIHTVLGLPDGATMCGHLLEAHVWPTLEMVLIAWSRPVRRQLDPQTGLLLLAP